jgi:hypothetical protein
MTNGVPRFFSPRITATDDNRFFLAWDKYVRTSDGSLENIFTAAYGTDGSMVAAPTQVTFDTPDWYYYYYDSALTELDGGRVLLAWKQRNGFAYQAFTSGGAPLSAVKVVSSWGWGPDVVQLSGGNILLAWTNYTWSGFTTRYRIAYTMINDTTFKRTRGVSYLKHTGAYNRGMYVSVTRDAAGNGILTWMDGLGYHLYYSLVNGTGRVLTAPVIFTTGDEIITSYEGYGNTTYTTP